MTKINVGGFRVYSKIQGQHDPGFGSFSLPSRFRSSKAKTNAPESGDNLQIIIQ